MIQTKTYFEMSGPNSNQLSCTRERFKVWNFSSIALARGSCQGQGAKPEKGLLGSHLGGPKAGVRNLGCEGCARYVIQEIKKYVVGEKKQPAHVHLFPILGLFPRSQKRWIPLFLPSAEKARRSYSLSHDAQAAVSQTQILHKYDFFK